MFWGRKKINLEIKMEIKNIQKRNSAFTLAEIIIVILVISILAGLIGPMFNGKVDAAKWAEWDNDLEVTIPLGDEAYIPYAFE